MGDDHKMKGGKSQAPTVHIKKFFAQGKKQVAAAAEGKKQGKSSRLYVKGVVAGFRRALTNQKTHTSLIKIQGVEDSNDVKFYLGKNHVHVPLQNYQGRYPLPCDVGQSLLCSWYQWCCSCQIPQESPSICD